MSLQENINAVLANGGSGVVDLPCGKTTITQGLTIQTNGAQSLWLRGRGWGNEIVFTGTGPAIVCSTTGPNQNQNVRLTDFQLTGQAGTGNGINLQQLHGSGIERVKVRGFGGHAVYMQGSYACYVRDSYLSNNAGHGVYAEAVAGSGNDYVRIIDNRLLANGGWGVYLDNRLYGPEGQHVCMNDIEGNAGGIRVDVGSTGNTEGLVLRGNSFENNVGFNLSLGEDGGSMLLNSPEIVSNRFLFGPGTPAANATRVGASVRGFTLAANVLTNSDLVVHPSATLALAYGNKSNGVMQGGYDSAGGVTLSQLRFLQPGGGAYSAMAMSGGMLQFNYPLGLAGKLYPATPNGTYQTAVGMCAGMGAPNNADGANGDHYFRGDGAVGSSIYRRQGGVWVALL